MVASDLAETVSEKLPEIWRFATRLLGGSQSVEKLVYSASAYALRNTQECPANTSALHWMLFSIYVCSSDVRWCNETRYPRGLSNDRGVDKVVWSVFSTLPVDEVCRHTLNAIYQLPRSQIGLLLLMYVEKFSDVELAELMGVSVHEIKKRTARARITLGTLLRVS
ncbi:RNA polymerase sigma factor [Pseudomonas fluorescens]